MPLANPHTRGAALLGTLCLVGIAGCRKPVAVAPAPVRGVVTFQGRPLSGGLVVFTPDRGSSASRSGGTKPFATRLDADGRYELAPAPPVAPGLPSGVSQGVPPGLYQVTFADAPRPAPTGFPADLRRPDTSGVARQVVAGRENVLDFHITASGG